MYGKILPMSVWLYDCFVSVRKLKNILNTKYIYETHKTLNLQLYCHKHTKRNSICVYVLNK